MGLGLSDYLHSQFFYPNLDNLAQKFAEISFDGLFLFNTFYLLLKKPGKIVQNLVREKIFPAWENMIII